MSNGNNRQRIIERIIEHQIDTSEEDVGLIDLGYHI